MFRGTIAYRQSQKLGRGISLAGAIILATTRVFLKESSPGSLDKAYFTYIQFSFHVVIRLCLLHPLPPQRNLVTRVVNDKAELRHLCQAAFAAQVFKQSRGSGWGRGSAATLPLQKRVLVFLSHWGGPTLSTATLIGSEMNM